MSEFAESVHIWLPGLAFMLVLMCCSAFFSASETAFFFLSRDQIRRFSSGNGRERMIASLMNDPDRLLTAVLFWNLLINLAYFAIGIVVMNRLSAGHFHIVAGCMGLLSLVGMIVFGEVAPKSAAVVFRLQVAPLASWPLAMAVRILDPVIPLLGRIARILRRTFWPHVLPEPHLQPEDLEKAIDASAALTSELLEAEQRVLHNILDLSEVMVEEVMRPRNLSLTVSPSDTFASMSTRSIGHTDYLMVREPGSEIVTQAVALSRVTGRTGATFGELAEPVIFVPWCANLAYVLAELRNRYTAVAVVLHEHGEMVGSVTYDDLLETIFSDSPSRTRRVLRREPLIEIGENRYHAEGLVTLRYLFRHLRVSYDADDEGLTTLAGLFHDELERMPQVGDRVKTDGWIFTAIEVSPRGQLRALIEPEVYQAQSDGVES
ncbi:MAG: hemolysin family protein [Planctomycetaceae bacterium]